ncbi:hypothetical protein, partial [Micromonospora endophytica]|uniref:hypothetical protein n=1 Tax=Micromonospora endophytica TaxID=515350 RepID=UPI0015E8ACCF
AATATTTEINATTNAARPRAGSGVGSTNGPSYGVATAAVGEACAGCPQAGTPWYACGVPPPAATGG